MTPSPYTATALAFLALAIGCSTEPATPSEPTTPMPSPASPTADSASADRYAPIAELAALDGRRPVPLQPMMAWHQKQNMMDHLVAIQHVTDGLAREDWDAIAAASAQIGISPQMQRMCEHMGAGAEGFTELALEFHRRADTIAEAARAHDGPGVLRATATTLEACTSCHAAYRQDVVDAATWQARTGSAHEPAPHGAHEMPTHEMPPHEMPTHAMPAHAMPAHAMPTHEMPTHEMPTHEVPTHEMPTHHAH